MYENTINLCFNLFCLLDKTQLITVNKLVINVMAVLV